MAIDSNTNIHERLAAAEAALHAVGQQISPAIRHIDIAVLVPAFNEAATIGEVVRSFRVALPHAKIYVYDNNSWDNTSTVAREAGAIVRREPLQGNPRMAMVYKNLARMEEGKRQALWARGEQLLARLDAGEAL